MKTFGLLKTKIESLLTESYKKNSFKEKIKIFKTLVLENKEFAQIYYIYENLSKPQDFSDETSKLFIDESVLMLTKLSKQVKTKDIEKWVKDIKVENAYGDIDSILSPKVLQIESIIKSKKRIMETLQGKKTTESLINLPIKTMVNLANKGLSEFVLTMDEGSKKELTDIISLSSDEVKTSFNVLRETTIKKLEDTLLEQTDIDMVKKINDTIEKIKSDTPTNLSLYKLRKLSEII